MYNEQMKNVLDGGCVCSHWLWQDLLQCYGTVGIRLEHLHCRKLVLGLMHLHWRRQRSSRATTTFWMAQRCGLAILNMLGSFWLWLMLSQLLWAAVSFLTLLHLFLWCIV